MNAIKTAIVVDTPYQIMSAVSYVTNHMGQEKKADIYIDTRRCVNYDMKKLFNRVKESGLFGDVVELNSLSSGKFGIIKKLANYYEWLFPKSSIKKGMSSKQSVSSLQYNKVVVSGPFMLQRNFIGLFPDAEIIFIEDGSGSYTDRIGVANLAKSGEMMQKLLRRGPKNINPDECFLFSPNYYRGEYKERTRKLLLAKGELLEQFFNISSEIYEKSKMVYFDQPKYSGEINKDTDLNIFQILNTIEGLVVRPHPQLKGRKYKNLIVDNEGIQWEMLCQRYVNDSTVLIGKYSTAQLSPKLIFDKEPYIVFTHRLYGKFSRIDSEIERFKREYKNPNKIFVPESIEEFREIITQRSLR